MSYETQMLILKVSALERFMTDVGKKLNCLPSYSDPLSNTHILDRIDALLNIEESAKLVSSTEEKAQANIAMVPCTSCGDESEIHLCKKCAFPEQYEDEAQHHS